MDSDKRKRYISVDDLEKLHERYLKAIGVTDPWHATHAFVRYVAEETSKLVTFPVLYLHQSVMNDGKWYLMAEDVTACYFRIQSVELFCHTPTYFATAEEAVAAGLEMGFCVLGERMADTNKCWICGKLKGQPPERCNGHYEEINHG